MTTTARRARVVSGACALALAVAIGAWFAWRRVHRDPLADLAAAVGAHHQIEGRLSGGFAPRAETPVRRGSPGGEADRLPPDARIAIARIEKAAAADRSPSAVAALGVAYLVDGEVDRAIAALDEAASMSDDPRTLSDLSAAYLTKAERMPQRRIEYLCRALDAATTSLHALPSNEARFNRALALHGLAPYVGIVAPWDEYLRTERDSPWTTAARRLAANPRTLADVRASWDDRRKVLVDKLAAHDHPFIVETAKRFPEAALEYFEQELVIPWARAIVDGAGARAAAIHAQAAEYAAVWNEATQDPMLVDVAARIESVSRNPTASLALGRAHLAYVDAVRRYRSDDYAGAMASVDAALAGFRQAKTPFWTWAALQRTVILFQMRDLDRAQSELAPIEDLARGRGYQTLLGRTLRQRGLIQSKQWRLAEALAAFEESVRCFETVGEQEDAVAVDSLIAANLRMLGEHHRSWEYVGRTLDGLRYLRTPLRRYLALYNASLFASSQDLIESALLFQDAAVGEARIRGGAPVIEALIERARIHVRRHDKESAVRDLRGAQMAVDGVGDASLKRGLRAEASILIAELDSDRDHQPAIDGLRDALEFFARTEPAFVPRLYLGLARAHAAAGSVQSAEQAFADGIAYLEDHQSRLGDDVFKISYFDESWDLFPEMVAFQIDVRHDAKRAFEYAERSRARSLGSGARPVGLADIQNRILPSTAVIYYLTLPDRILIWTITADGYALSETRIRKVDLSRLVSRYVSSLEENGTRDVRLDGSLYEALMRPIAAAIRGHRTLVFVADADLQRLPFPALRNPENGRFLIEDHAILASPSAAVFAAGHDRLRGLNGHPVDSALLIGNPAADIDRSDAPSLPGAEAEALGAAAFYPIHDVLLGSAATKARLIEGVGAYDVVHFGGHGFVNPEYPLLSRLALSPSRPGGLPEMLFAHEIARIAFRRTRLVVLAACGTAVGAISRGEGVVSIARPFLAAGVPTVIASQWDVDDVATARLFLAFHRAMAATRDPIAALRSAQLSLLRSGDARLASPRSWGAFVALGASVE